MAKADLTAQRLRELLSYDQETGVFRWLQEPARRSKVGAIAGWNDGGYWRLCVDSRKHWAHRLAWLHATGHWPENDIDHIDGDRGNNRLPNLRDVSTATNVQNVKSASKKNRTGLLGVEATASGTFQARIKADGRRYSLGTHKTKEEAHGAYLSAKRRLHSGCTI